MCMRVYVYDSKSYQINRRFARFVYCKNFIEFYNKGMIILNSTKAWSWWTLNDKGFRAFLRGGATRCKLQSFCCKHSFSIRDAAVYRTLECGSPNKRWLTMTNISGHVTNVTFSRVNHLSAFRRWSNEVHLARKNSWFIGFYRDIMTFDASQLILSIKRNVLHARNLKLHLCLYVCVRARGTIFNTY